mmetsp:Transcript_19617/g.49023  ORF Transcript_19617/g.49023 Transcript_19617/m.49023 type:complete len:203 (-) Transcript_19617:20-628(-)
MKVLSCFSSLSSSSLFSHPASSMEHPPQIEHSSSTKAWAFLQGFLASRSSCVVTQRMRAPHVAFTSWSSQTASQPKPLVVVLATVAVEVEVFVVLVVVVWVDVLLVAVVVVVDGQPRDSCSQHQAFQSGVHAVCHVSYSAEQSYRGGASGTPLATVIIWIPVSAEAMAAPRASTVARIARTSFLTAKQQATGKMCRPKARHQ